MDQGEFEDYIARRRAFFVCGSDHKFRRYQGIKKETKKETEIKFNEDRPGHDRRYSLDSTKIRQDLGWNPHIDFDNALFETVKWYLENEIWWTPLLSSSILHPQPWKCS